MRVRDCWIVALPLAASGCVTAGAPISAYGRPATVHAEGARTSGELLAASADTVWMLWSSGLRPIPASSIRRVDVQRHTFGLRRTLKWLGFAGLGTGAALMISCSSYYSSQEDGGGADCYGVVPGTMLVFAAAGLLLGSINEYTTKHRLRGVDTERLRTWSRYPQGIPDLLRRVPVIPAAPR